MQRAQLLAETRQHAVYVSTPQVPMLRKVLHKITVIQIVLRLVIFPKLPQGRTLEYFRHASSDLPS